ncbi:MAG TPA: hypothetical protein VHB70_04550 [Parafilimonas sp.]|nr:hypothetical protein [Parafilimonas sp.]
MKQTKLLYPFLLFLYYSTNAQNSFDSSFTKAVSIYTNTLNTNIHLYNGSEYIDYDHRIKGNPLYQSLSYVPGSIIYDGTYYGNVEMFYDILHDDVIIKNYNDTALLLVKEKVSSFDILNHHFIQLHFDSSEKHIESNVFYDVLCNGNAKLFAKRRKEIVEKIVLQVSESYYNETDTYFIYNRNNFYAVKNKASVLDALRDKKTELVKFMHQSKIKFRQDPETSMIKMVTYYNTLNSGK